ncbi:uncharacterized protein MEPE_03272 [Melanopsichium pennsylvanicum]|uniref:Uncharacterized protein n=1 Tax=Melanopsichium pennsylvanicum TaxID=63383 RepID=A0AAJ4XP21_9BASI|nr:uncharacterized protein MEPE_03272 [Melanopsichium pennsylvanicum]
MPIAHLVAREQQEAEAGRYIAELESSKFEKWWRLNQDQVKAQMKQHNHRPREGDTCGVILIDDDDQQSFFYVADTSR